MVDAVNIVTVQNTTPRTSSQSEAPSAPAETTSVTKNSFVTSSIRVDNLQNVAILEYRSSRTGEVVQQYPTQSQIDAFKRAESIQAERKASAPHHEAAPQAEHNGGETAAAAPAVHTPAPAPSAPVSSSPTGVEHAGTGSTHSSVA